MTKRSAGNANSKSISFTIPGALPSGNKFLRMCWQKRHRLTERYAWEIIALTGRSQPVRPRKCAVSIVVYQPHRRFDEDNLVGATKAVVDALRKVGLIYRDSPRWLTREVSQEIDRKNPRVEITVEET